MNICIFTISRNLFLAVVLGEFEKSAKSILKYHRKALYKFNLELEKLDDPEDMGDKLFKKMEKKRLTGLIEKEKAILTVPLMRVAESNANREKKLQSPKPKDKRGSVQNVYKRRMTAAIQAVKFGVKVDMEKKKQSKAIRDYKKTLMRDNPHSNKLKRSVREKKPFSCKYYFTFFL